MTQTEKEQIAALSERVAGLSQRVDEYRAEVSQWHTAQEGRLQQLELDFVACKAASKIARTAREREGGRIWEYVLIVIGAVTSFLVSGVLGKTFGR